MSRTDHPRPPHKPKAHEVTLTRSTRQRLDWDTEELYWEWTARCTCGQAVVLSSKRAAQNWRRDHQQGEVR